METSLTPRDTSAGGGRRASLRSCVACRSKESPPAPGAGGDLVRWVHSPELGFIPDLSGKFGGRGAWCHARPACLKKLPTALAKVFETERPPVLDELLGMLGQAADQQVRHMLGAGRRQRRLALGATAVAEAVRRGEAGVVVVARDAQAASRLPEVLEMVRTGRGAAWGSKDELGRICGRPEIGVLAVLDLRLAERLFGAIAMAPRASGYGVPQAIGAGANHVLDTTDQENDAKPVSSDQRNLLPRGDVAADAAARGGVPSDAVHLGGSRDNDGLTEAE